MNDLFDELDDDAPPSSGGAEASTEATSAFSGAVSGRRLVIEADGGSRGNPGPAGYGAVVRDADSGELLAERADFLGQVSNNVAEYSGLIAGLRAALDIDPSAALLVRMDSKLVVEQMSGRWKIKHEDMRRLALQARELLRGVDVAFEWVPRANNKAADALANKAMDTRGEHRWDGRDDGSASNGDDATTSVDGQARSTARPRPSGASPAIADPLGTTTIVFVRHGVTEMTLARRFSGSGGADPALTDLGHQQARGAAAILTRLGGTLWSDLPQISRIVASPILRTQQTAAAIGEAVGIPVTTDERFREAAFGEWEGLTFAEIAEQWPAEYEAWSHDPAVAPPGGESLTMVEQRLRPALDGLLADHRGQTVVVVSHVLPIRISVATSLGLARSRWTGLRVSPASMHILRTGADSRLEVVALGVPPELS